MADDEVFELGSDGTFTIPTKPRISEPSPFYEKKGQFAVLSSTSVAPTNIRDSHDLANIDQSLEECSYKFFEYGTNGKLIAVLKLAENDSVESCSATVSTIEIKSRNKNILYKIKTPVNIKPYSANAYFFNSFVYIKVERAQNT